MSTRAADVLPSGQGLNQGMQPWNDQGSYVARSMYTYESDTTASLAAGASANLTFNIAGDSDFFWNKFAVWALVGGVATLRNAEQLAAVTILVTNTTTGRSYSSSATPLANVAGTGTLPFILPQITYWQAKSTIAIALQNVGNAAYSAIYLSFMGIKAFTR